jgi:hypothetical protein
MMTGLRKAFTIYFMNFVKTPGDGAHPKGNPTHT